MQEFRNTNQNRLGLYFNLIQFSSILKLIYTPYVALKLFVYIMAFRSHKISGQVVDSTFSENEAMNEITSKKNPPVCYPINGLVWASTISSHSLLKVHVQNDWDVEYRYQIPHFIALLRGISPYPQS